MTGNLGRKEGILMTGEDGWAEEVAEETEDEALTASQVEVCVTEVVVPGNREAEGLREMQGQSREVGQMLVRMEEGESIKLTLIPAQRKWTLMKVIMAEVIAV